MFAAAAQQAGAVAAAEGVVGLILRGKRREKLTRGLGVVRDVPAAAIIRWATGGVADVAVSREVGPEPNGNICNRSARGNPKRAILHLITGEP